MDNGKAKLSFGAQRLFEFSGAFCILSYQQISQETRDE